MAQPVDPSSFAAAGDPFPLAEQVFFAPISGHAPVSASGSGIFAYQAGGNRAEHQLAWHDRTGKELAKVGTPGLLLGLALSPDEKRVALARGGPGGSTDLWLHELARGSDTRFTFSGGRNAEPVWSPDGRRLAFGSGRAGVSNLYHKDTSGAGQDEALLDPGSARFVTDWSRDGRFLLYSELTAKSQDIQVLPLDGDRKPISFLQTEFLESQGQFSPDGRWVAYTSDESGRLEVYVRPFPPTGPGGKWKVSIAGGQLPRWRRDGKELFYIAPDRKLMAAGVNAAAGPPPSFEASSPQALFETRMVPSTPGFNVFYYAVAGDGKRFLIASTAGETADAPVTVVVGGL
jgi:Tol biopolymer transport system component